jgi:hypothetical protein
MTKKRRRDGMKLRDKIKRTLVANTKERTLLTRDELEQMADGVLTAVKEEICEVFGVTEAEFEGK